MNNEEGKNSEYHKHNLLSVLRTIILRDDSDLAIIKQMEKDMKIGSPIPDSLNRWKNVSNIIIYAMQNPDNHERICIILDSLVHLDAGNRFTLQKIAKLIGDVGHNFQGDNREHIFQLLVKLIYFGMHDANIKEIAKDKVVPVVIQADNYIDEITNAKTGWPLLAHEAYMSILKISANTSALRESYEVPVKEAGVEAEDAASKELIDIIQETNNREIIEYNINQVAFKHAFNIPTDSNIDAILEAMKKIIDVDIHGNVESFAAPKLTISVLLTIDKEIKKAQENYSQNPKDQKVSDLSTYQQVFHDTIAREMNAIYAACSSCGSLFYIVKNNKTGLLGDIGGLIVSCGDVIPTFGGAVKIFGKILEYIDKTHQENIIQNFKNLTLGIVDMDIISKNIALQLCLLVNKESLASKMAESWKEFIGNIISIIISDIAAGAQNATDLSLMGLSEDSASEAVAQAAAGAAQSLAEENIFVSATSYSVRFYNRVRSCCYGRDYEHVVNPASRTDEEAIAQEAARSQEDMARNHAIKIVTLMATEIFTGKIHGEKDIIVSQLKTLVLDKYGESFYQTQNNDGQTAAHEIAFSEEQKDNADMKKLKYDQAKQTAHEIAESIPYIRAREAELKIEIKAREAEIKAREAEIKAREAQILMSEAEIKAREDAIKKLKLLEDHLLTKKTTLEGKTIAEFASQSQKLKNIFIEIFNGFCPKPSDTIEYAEDQILEQTLATINNGSYIFRDNDGNTILDSNITPLHLGGNNIDIPEIGH
ncbi:MAG: hypothetical protein SFT68_05400 [Rickettsiaceae bacterium]|nr:hypothetical protein [Rickettsiaceae bacterium]